MSSFSSKLLSQIKFSSFDKYSSNRVRSEMDNFVDRQCLKIIYFLYNFGKCFGIVTAYYDPETRTVKRSKLLTNLFAGFRTVLAFVVATVTCLVAYYKLNANAITLVIQNIYTFSTTVPLIRAQLKDANALIEVINEFISLVFELKSKKGVHRLFRNTFFVMLFLKVFTTTLLCICEIPALFYMPDSLSLMLFLGEVFIWCGTLIFFNFAFIGLMMASFQANMFEFMENCWKLKELDEYSTLSVRFYRVFHKFLGLVRTHFLMALLFYTVSLGYGLSVTISGQFDNTYFFIQAYTYHTCCIVDVILFNMAADLVERNSRKRNFAKVDFLTNDSKQVGLLSTLVGLPVHLNLSDGHTSFPTVNGKLRDLASWSVQDGKRLEYRIYFSDDHLCCLFGSV